MRTFHLSALLVPVFALLAAAPEIKATPLFTATYNLTGGTCGAVICGTVTLTGIDNNDVMITVASSDPSNIGFIQNGSHTFFGLNIDEAVTFSAPSGSPLVTPPSTNDVNPGFSQPAEGNFNYAFNCTGANNCGPQLNKSTLGFSLTVFSAAGLSASDFFANTSGNTFTVDVTYTANGVTSTGPIGSTPCTGDCGGGGGVQAVPEPVSFLLVGSGLIATFFLRRKRSI